MSSPPLAATQIQPPPDPTAQIARAMQLKSMLFGQQLTAADLQQKNLSNQQLQASLDGQQRLRAAQADPNFDPTDTNKALKVMSHYQVPLEVSGKVISAIGQIRTGLQQQSTENLTNSKNALDFWDDQLQAVKNAPADQKQSAYESAIQNAKDHANLLPDGPAKQQYLSGIASAPPIADLHWIDQKHLETRTVSQLTEEALKNAQAREASGRADESSQQAANLAAKSNPSSPLFEPTTQATALGAQNGNPWASAIEKGEATQAGAVEGAKAKANYPYQQSLEQIRQQVAQTQQISKDARDKIEGTVLKPYEDKMSQIGELNSAIDQASQGNIAAARAALYKTIGVAQPAGTHRVAPTEVTGFSGMGGISQRVQGSIANALSGDPWTPQMVQDIKSFADGQARVASSNLNRGIGNVNRLYNTNVGQGLTDNSGGSGGTVKMRAPNGQIKDVDQADVNHYKQMGATVVQ
jgi:hypothetical protein